MIALPDRCQLGGFGSLSNITVPHGVEGGPCCTPSGPVLGDVWSDTWHAGMCVALVIFLSSWGPSSSAFLRALPAPTSCAYGSFWSK